MTPRESSTTTNRRRARRGLRAPALAIAALALLAACGSDDASGESSADTSGGDRAQLDVVASFYPLQFVVERVGGDLVGVTNLTPEGAEPHDLELTPQDTVSLQNADLIVYLADFAPSLDASIGSVGGSHAFDVTPIAHLDLDATEADHDEHAGEEPAGEEHEEGEGGEAEHEGVDPHFWLDPTRLADVADAVAERLAELDPDHAAELTQRAAALRRDLEDLDGELEAGLAHCANTSIVTSHSAFAYLAHRYGLTQIGISGLSPEEEPSPAKLAEVTQFVHEHDVSTIYYETLVDPGIAETIANETGATTAVLDPIEGLTKDSSGSDYLEVMRSNLETLRTGQHCT